jgi:hypothetical protein
VKEFPDLKTSLKRSYSNRKNQKGKEISNKRKRFRRDRNMYELKMEGLVHVHTGEMTKKEYDKYD